MLKKLFIILPGTGSIGWTYIPPLIFITIVALAILTNI